MWLWLLSRKSRHTLCRKFVCLLWKILRASEYEIKRVIYMWIVVDNLKIPSECANHSPHHTTCLSHDGCECHWAFTWLFEEVCIVTCDEVDNKNVVWKVQNVFWNFYPNQRVHFCCIYTYKWIIHIHEWRRHFWIKSYLISFFIKLGRQFQSLRKFFPPKQIIPP